MMKQTYENKVLVIKEEVKDEEGNTIGVIANITRIEEEDKEEKPIISPTAVKETDKIPDNEKH